MAFSQKYEHIRSDNNYYVNLPCTPLAVMHIIEYLENVYQSNVFDGKLCAMIGRSSLVGTPLHLMLNARNMTTILCHSKTPPQQLKQLCKMCDVIVVAVGKPNLIDRDCIKKGCIVIDVGTNVLTTNDNMSISKTMGDVNFENCKDLTSAITPVPGGVGPCTVAMLFSNTIRAAKSNELKKLSKNAKL